MRFRRLYRRTLIALVAVFALSVLSWGIFYLRLQQELAIGERLTLVREEIESVDELLTQLLNLETGWRGYLNTRDKRFLEPYWEGKRKVPLALVRLEQLKPSSKELRERVQQVLTIFDTAVQLGETNPTQLASSKAIMDQIRVTLDGLKAGNVSERDRLLQQRNSRQQLDLWLGLLSGLLTLLLLWFVSQSASDMKQAFRKAEDALRLEEELRQAEELARIEAERSSRAKTVLMQTVSHEYRVPLTIIRSAADLLERVDPTSPKREKYFNQIREGIRRLVSLMEDVRTYFQFDAGAGQTEAVTIQLHSWFQELITSFVDGDRVNLNIQVEAITVDEGLLYKIFINLIGNALKYSEAPVFVSAIAEAEGIRFVVKDSGIGIPKSMQLFEAFQRGSNVGKVSGTGLGLSIVKKAVDLLGGAIAFTSEEGEGTEVVVKISSMQARKSPEG